MNINLTNFSRRTITTGSILLVMIICGFYLGFMQQFISYATDMLNMVSRSANYYLHIVPPQINH